MGAVRQAVDDGDGRMFGHLEQRRLFEGPDHDQVDIARQDPRGVGDGLAMTELHLLARQHHRLAAHLADADVEGNAGAGRRLFEDQRDHMALQGLLVIGRPFRSPVPRGLHGLRAVDHRPQVVRGGLVDVEEVFHFVSLFEPGQGGGG
jgi:hypothetical protein